MTLQRGLTAWTDELQPPGLPNGPLNAQEQDWYRHYFGLSETNQPNH